MKKIGFLVIALILFTLFCLTTQQKPKVPTLQSSEPNSTHTGEANPKTNQTQKKPDSKYDDLSAQFMTEYGKETSPAQNDLIGVAAMLDSYFNLVKTVNPMPLGENRTITLALTGENSYRTRLLSPDSPWINQMNELVDRWNTPLYFHAVSAKQIGIRSAGPDKKMWTSDDLIDGPNAEPFK